MINRVYAYLLKEYGPQGWWPIVDAGRGMAQYHVSAPRDESDSFEIAVGAVLTQNVAWSNVVPALANLKNNSLLSPPALYRARHETVASNIRSSGYFNQKARRLRELSRWFIDNSSIVSSPGSWDTLLLREKLLNITGVGPETADSILLYAFTKKVFVVDSYTKRIFSRIDVLQVNHSYHDIQKAFHESFTGGLEEYREYHALIVAHAKDFCKKKPLCAQCCLKAICRGAEL